MALTAQRYGRDLAETEPTARIQAAGALCWRIHEGELQVLLIHRPKYDDWSWPKGKLDPGETMPECAVREIAEEINLDIQLGIPLPITRYQVKNRSKEVWYWAAEVTRQRPQPDGGEVDDFRWANVKTARKLLTMPGDQVPLDHLIAAHRHNALRTLPFVVVRHAKAKPRPTWTRAEGDRPLAATGRRQALAVAKLLSAWSPKYLVSSPWTRCIETLTPFVRATGLRLRHKKSLTEVAVTRSPGKAASTITKLLAKVRSTAVCTHRPVLPQVLESLSKATDLKYAPELAGALPARDPYLKPGAVIVCHQAPDRDGKIVAIEVYDSFDD
ncbi:NUDIX hydrolase [Micrococcoides hystricis]|uniref:NUDIX domain-containing protein n=1 Tax=Micrococcoides hystricis TaxID=1572761 RepID=A0ABV6PB84_9MICC